MSRYVLLVLFAIIITGFTSETTRDYPQDYFIAPVKHQMFLSGTFGELRSNHFHAGIDIKANNGIGNPLLAVADGYVSRINVSSRGYGNAIYIDHPNGYTSVYAHLLKFPKHIAEFIKKEQYTREQFEVELYPSAYQFEFNQGEILGYMGTSGHSYGPHLHFEIRETSTEIPINPLLFGLKVSDNVPPAMNELKVYHLDRNFRSKKEQVFITRKGAANYYISKDTLHIATDYLGLGLKVYDKMSTNLNGIYKLSVLQDGNPIYSFNMEAISFDESRYINAHVDYAAWRKADSRFNKCFVLPGNKLSIYDNVANGGLISLNSDAASKIELIAEDVMGNASRLVIFARKKGEIPEEEDQVFNYFLPRYEESMVSLNNLKLHFPNDAFYLDQHLLYREITEVSDGFYSGIHEIGDEMEPVHKRFSISIKPNQIPDGLKSKALIARCDGETILESLGGEWVDDWIEAKSRSFGDFCVVLDTQAPSILPGKINEVMSSGFKMTFSISDDLSGIKSYRGTIDGQWVLIEYDQKYSRLSHVISQQLFKGQHIFELVVTDHKGNSKNFVKSFQN